MRQPNEIKIGDYTLAEILERHIHWLNKDCNGWERMRADLQWANLQEANLQRANLQWANLRGANLQWANLLEADLRGANLQWANLLEADLRGARDVPFIPMACPDAGAFVAWKKIRTINGVAIAKLLIPDGVPRSSATGRKCRAERAKVLEIQDIDGNKINVSGTSPKFNSVLTYRAGDMVIADFWDEDRWNECSHGIHFLLTDKKLLIIEGR